jgi:hypothetical protein
MESRSSSIASRLENPDEGFQVSIDEALLFSNGASVADEYLKAGGHRLVDRLAQLSDVNEITTGAFTCVLSRPPTEDERAAVASYLEQRRDRPVEGVQQVVWALLASPEFRFNH